MHIRYLYFYIAVIFLVAATSGKLQAVTHCKTVCVCDCLFVCVCECVFVRICRHFFVVVAGVVVYCSDSRLWRRRRRSRWRRGRDILNTWHFRRQIVRFLEAATLLWLFLCLWHCHEAPSTPYSLFNPCLASTASTSSSSASSFSATIDWQTNFAIQFLLCIATVCVCVSTRCVCMCVCAHRWLSIQSNSHKNWKIACKLNK